ncbi:MAG: hypothetical protein D6B25_17000 [Desulfobulbaceae bacterium]|nr:MAG: hypothetical protein D6B25_17000 [Desulfobulbaceae bacterium]
MQSIELHSGDFVVKRVGFDSQGFRIEGAGDESEPLLPYSHLNDIEIQGIKRHGEYSGSMEWGMANPTFIQPVNFWLIIFNYFTKKKDIVYFKASFTDQKYFVGSCQRARFNQLKRLIKRANGTVSFSTFQASS